MASNCDTYIEVDLHKKSIYVTVVKPNGEIARQTGIENKGEAIKTSFAKYAVGPKIAVESTMNWIPSYERLESLGCDFNLSNPLMTNLFKAGVEGEPDNLFTKKGRKFLAELQIRVIYRRELNRSVLGWYLKMGIDFKELWIID